MKTAQDLFGNRPLIVASMHGKHQAMIPLTKAFRGLQLVIPKDFDTDAFGTFSGEVERKDDPLTTLRNKCLLAMDTYQCNFGIASEGSFGPHPSTPFLKADDELVMLIDRKNSLEIVAREVSTLTNFDAAEISSEDELKKFARACFFPSHALILSDNDKNHHIIYKGIQEEETLLRKFREIKSQWQKVYVQTDMRAMHNPTRMQVIQKAVEKLIVKMNTLCPHCHTQGFDVVDIKQGLPCQLCGTPTRSTLSLLYGCRTCQHREEKEFPNGKMHEEPLYCDYCNP